MNALVNLTEEQKEWIRGKNWQQIAREKGVTGSAVYRRNHYLAPRNSPKNGSVERCVMQFQLDPTSLLEAKLAEERQVIRVYKRLLECHRQVRLSIENELERREVRCEPVAD